MIAVFGMLLSMLVAGFGTGTAQAQGGSQYRPYPRIDTRLDRTLLAKAPVDECFNGIGKPITYPDENGHCATGVPKVNESYVWGLTKSGSSLWFGTAANVLCGVLFGYLEVSEPVGGQPGDDYVCERSVAATSDPPMPARTDSRVPSIYEYDLATRTLIQHAGPKNGVVSGTVTGWTPEATALLRATSGFRSAGSLGNVVILAGPGRSLTNVSGINVFAFDASNDSLIGYTSLTDYSNIRKWITYDGALYTGVAVKSGGGRVLRWNGTADPLGFTEVGRTGSEIAELVVHEGRLFGASWPQHGAVEVPAGLYMSPPIPAGGLTTASDWEMVWSATDYEPDPVTATTYGTGALASFGGYLYWGTMHVPGRAAIAHDDVYGEPTSQQQSAQTFLNTLRAVSIFRGKNFGTTAVQKQLVYGESQLSTWDPASAQWVMKPTGMGRPIWGPSGFGNPFNNYTWTMDVYHGSLYIGTMDWSYLALGQQELSPEVTGYLERLGYSFGADLLRIDSSARPGVFESVNGVGNVTNYGIRTMVSDDALYLGTANPMNLMPQGGWELVRLRTHYTFAVKPGTSVNPKGTQRTLTATLSPAKQGITVQFTVTGANAGSGTATTNANGIATWSYRGASAGVDKVKAAADVMGYGWTEDMLTATATAYWVSGSATINGNARYGGISHPLSGTVGDAGGAPVGSIQVGYSHGGKCRLTPDANSTIAISPQSAVLTGWASDDLGTRACLDSSNVKVVLKAQSGKSRGSIVIDINGNGRTERGDLGIPTPLSLTGGKVVVVKYA